MSINAGSERILQRRAVYAESVEAATKAKKLIREIEIAKATGDYTDPDMVPEYSKSVREALARLREAHTKITPDSTKWGERSIKILKKLEILAGDVVVSTKDGKLVILPSHVSKKMKTICELKSDKGVGEGVVPLDNIHSEILSYIISYIENPVFKSVSKNSLIELYEAANYLDVEKIGAKEETLSEECLTYGSSVLTLGVFTSEFCKKLSVGQYLKKQPGLQSSLTDELLRDPKNELLVQNFKNIAPYINSLMFTKSTTEAYFDDFMSNLAKFNLKIEEIGIHSGWSVGLSERDIDGMRKIGKDVKLFVELATECPLIKSVCELPQLYSLALQMRGKEPISFIPKDGMQNITQLWINSNCIISDEDLNILAEKCPKLSSLDLAGSTFQELPLGFPMLKTLDVKNNTRLTSDGLAIAITYPQLEELAIDGCTRVEQLSDGFIGKLKKVSAKGSGLTPEAKAAIKAKFKLESIS